ncbi:THUMP-like domain-containing protein [Lacinutrix jangbogonensis]|uniref:THUMP-like domain-containing protein n=1 Tax=Lacinutrix jangbogonensis TaxID=1469557 RepID=UPI00053DC649|nr:RsmD family RNA methyltransferase [Lacinutrix jangbogonensis]
MNKALLNTENQLIINSNLYSNISDLLLKGIATSTAETKELIHQIEAKKRCEKKLKTWISSENIYYPNKLNIEQTSSEITAQYKANLISGESLIDLTGGFGVDCYYFSKRIDHVYHCEIDNSLSQIVKHNYQQLGIENITCLAESGITALEQEKRHFDWVYIDPSRRDDTKGKVFLLKDCLPNVPEHLQLLFKYSKNVMIKTSPLLDITSGISELCNVKTIHSIAVKNEVKELLWILERDYNGTIAIKTVNITKENNQIFDFNLNEEYPANASLSEPLTYLYEPNAAILKAGAFDILAKKLNLKKLHKHSHLYTSTKQVNFPGRCFKIETVLEYNKKKFKRGFKSTKANVSTRNFPATVQQIREKLNLKDGGDDYLFFTTDLDNNKMAVICKKA